MRIGQGCIFLLTLATLASCAKQSSPTGGPRDEDPPKLISSSPSTSTTSVKPDKILLTFDEYVALENPNKGIVITPKINKDLLEITALKNTVSIVLKQELEDSTTYVFDFQKSVVDLSEKNPVENLRVVFSTGPQIDSLSISGQLRFAFPTAQEDYKNVLVGLYPMLDSADLFTASPYYLTQVDTLGEFTLNNLREGVYRAYAWRDNNGNLKAEFKNEEHDFLLDSLPLSAPIEGLTFNLSKADLTPIKITRTANFGRNYDVLLNRNVSTLDLKAPGLGKDLFYTTSDKRIRFYPTELQTDSIPIQLSLRDSVGFTRDSLLWAKFPSSERKPEKLDSKANSGKSFYQNLQIELEFNKPIATLRLDSLYIKYDSASRIPIKREMIQFTDSLRRDFLRLHLTVPDSLSAELFTLVATDSAFQDIEGQYNEKGLAANYRKLKRKDLADGVSGTLLGGSPPYVVQLINSKQEVAYQTVITAGNAFSFTLLEPATYTLRVIEDSNGNGIWDASNYDQRRNAERVFYYLGEEDNPELIVRGGWTLEDLVIQANPATGIHKSEKKPVDKP